MSGRLRNDHIKLFPLEHLRRNHEKIPRHWLNPVVSIFFGYTGITMTKMTEEEYQHLLKVREEEKAVALAAMEA